MAAVKATGGMAAVVKEVKAGGSAAALKTAGAVAVAAVKATEGVAGAMAAIRPEEEPRRQWRPFCGAASVKAVKDGHGLGSEGWAWSCHPAIFCHSTTSTRGYRSAAVRVCCTCCYTCWHAV